MLSLSYTAAERLDHMLADAEAPEDAVIRFVVVEGGGVSIEIDTFQPGDTKFAHEERTVLAIDKQVSEFLADMKLDVKVTGAESELVLIEQVEK